MRIKGKLCINPDDLSGGTGGGIFPDLRVDQEVLWPMRRNGKQVYAKLIDFGGFPAPYGLSGKTHGIQNIEWKQISWEHSSITSSTDTRERSFGLVATPENIGTPGHWRFLIDHNSVQVNMLSKTDYRMWDKIELCILYTKTTDEPVTP